MKKNPNLGYLNNLLKTSPEIQIRKKDKYVIFSDLHIGDGGRNDDFLQNAELFKKVLEKYYLANDYNLILNGDVEELQRFPLYKIKRQWENLYRILNNFKEKESLIKIYGNHDYDLFLENDTIGRNPDIPVLESLKLKHKDGTIFIFHGHQASPHYAKHHKKISFMLRVFANPLGIGNYSLAHDSKKRYYIEQRIYNFARINKVIAVIGHTHRPLFEALSKIDFLKYIIEELCRKYAAESKKKKKEIEIEIKEYQKELENYSYKDVKKSLRNTLYAANIVIPCIFNSGCCIGKRGITSIEITYDEIYLVHWFDSSISKKYLNYHGNYPEKIAGTNYFRMVLKKDYLDYIFTRIKLLS